MLPPVYPQTERVHQSQSGEMGVIYSRCHGYTTAPAELMHGGMEAFLTPSIAL